MYQTFFPKSKKKLRGNACNIFFITKLPYHKLLVSLNNLIDFFLDGGEEIYITVSSFGVS